ncbi:ASB_HP2_G0031410.mRNA.1.CDS.1 [Saccharomyces cerevisiae]|nr:ASB_HP2_G0031410.mRNA.1.CDS.1 [Saccharomyces cerevisiae]CAI6609252.1 ASB_HP2_G0031410.mRNA.1.CDS.1 [Saccharomyces cerevisiae]
MSEQHSVAVGKAADEHETAPRRNVRVKKRPLIRPLNSSASTLYEFALELTAYDTLGESGLIHSMVETESAAIFTDNQLLAKMMVPLQSAKDIKFLIHNEPIDPKMTEDKTANFTRLLRMPLIRSES